MPGGRNSRLTDELKEEILLLVGSGLYLKQVCEYVGVSESTIYYWLKRGSEEVLRLESNPKARPSTKEQPYVDFYYAMKRAENQSEVRAVGNWQKAMKDDWRAAREFLARRFPDRWSPRIEITGAEGNPIELKMDIDVVTLEQKVMAVLEARNARSISGSTPEIESN